MINHWTSRVPWLTNLDLPKVDPISCQVEEEEYDEEAEEEELDDDGEWESDDYEYEDWFAPCRLLPAFLHGFQRLTTPMNFKEFQAMSCVDIGRGCDQLRSTDTGPAQQHAEFTKGQW